MHILLHDILNIPPSQYSKWTRDFKKQTNGKKIRTPADIDMIYDIQCAFFYNLDKLPKQLQQQHLIKMREYMQRELMEALKVGVEFSENNDANLNFN
ncbi:MAG: hypothetical protein NZZ41_02715 [Candidatus Dojkabacteria bacterium]|nr:hypothetical protein [Candidatus Dojkabacteria bacterium]